MTLTTRAGKGSALTWDELDANFSSIEGDTLLSTDVPAGWVPIADGVDGVTWATGATVGGTGRTYYFCNTTSSDISGYKEAPISINGAHTETSIAYANTGTLDFTTQEEFATLVGEPSVSTFPSGMFYCHVHAKTGGNNEVAQVRMMLYSRDTAGTETYLGVATSESFSGTTTQELVFNATILVPVELDPTDRLVFKIQTARVSGPATCNTTLYFEGTATAGFAIVPLAGASPTNLTIIDEGNYYAATNVEDALQEVAARDVGFRNRIINGDMRIDQRNDGAAVTTGYAVDRWVYDASGAGTFSLERVDTGGPTGFPYFYRATVTSADASLAAGDTYLISQKIEGTNVADLDFGLSTAQTITISFYVRSSLTGTFSGSIANQAGGTTRGYGFTYAISAANTWEKKTVTITGDTGGTWPTTTSVWGALRFDFGSGSNYTVTAGSWTTATSQVVGVTGSTALVSTLSATWDITGVQLEVGSAATPFERRPYGTELALCQRYYLHIKPGTAGGDTTGLIGVIASATAANRCQISLPVEMRTKPTGNAYLIQMYDGSNIGNVTSIGDTGTYATPRVGSIDLGMSGGGFTAGRAAVVLFQNSTSGYITFSAEL